MRQDDQAIFCQGNRGDCSTAHRQGTRHAAHPSYARYRKSRRRMLPLVKASSKAQANSGCRKVGRALMCLLQCCPGHISEKTCCLLDISELDLKKGTSINFPEGKDKLMHFEIKIRPEEGTYKSVCLPAGTVLGLLSLTVSDKFVFAELVPSCLTSQ